MKGRYPDLSVTDVNTSSFPGVTIIYSEKAPLRFEKRLPCERSDYRKTHQGLRCESDRAIGDELNQGKADDENVLSIQIPRCRIKAEEGDHAAFP